jgi:hypothetical protein
MSHDPRQAPAPRGTADEPAVNTADRAAQLAGLKSLRDQLLAALPRDQGRDIWRNIKASFGLPDDADWGPAFESMPDEQVDRLARTATNFLAEARQVRDDGLDRGPGAGGAPDDGGLPPITDEQVGQIAGLVTRLFDGVPREEASRAWRDTLLQLFGVTSPLHLVAEQAEELITFMADEVARRDAGGDDEDDADDADDAGEDEDDAPPPPPPPPLREIPPQAGLPPEAADEALVAKACRAGKGIGKEFAKLWRGDTSDHGGDHSKADAALCRMLAFWTRKNRHWMDRIFRKSGLMRPKWDEVRGRTTYGAKTISYACKVVKQTYGDKFKGRKAAAEAQAEAPPAAAPAEPEQPTPTRPAAQPQPQKPARPPPRPQPKPPTSARHRNGTTGGTAAHGTESPTPAPAGRPRYADRASPVG